MQCFKIILIKLHIRQRKRRWRTSNKQSQQLEFTCTDYLFYSVWISFTCVIFVSIKDNTSIMKKCDNFYVLISSKSWLNIVNEWLIFFIFTVIYIDAVWLILVTLKIGFLLLVLSWSSRIPKYKPVLCLFWAELL